MKPDEWRVQLTQGDGEVHRDGATVFVVGRVEPRHEDFLRDLQAAIAEATAHEPWGPGRRVARSCAGLLSQAVPDAVPDLGIVSAADEGVVILLCSDAAVQVTEEDGEVLDLTSRDVASWVDRQVRKPFQQLVLHVGQLGTTLERSDLRAGIVSGGGVFVSARAADVSVESAGSARTTGSAADEAPAAETEVGSTARDASAAPDAPAATTELELESVEPEPDGEPEFVAFSLKDSSEEQSPPLAVLEDHPHVEDEPANVDVDGIRCSRGHFNDPRNRFCSSCGISMVQQTHDLVPGTRPSLGVLVLDDGSAYNLTSDYVLGREPGNAPEVIGGAALPLTLTDPDLTMSRIHARISMSGWDVRVVDAGSANGTFVAAPGNDWTRLNPEEPVTIVPETRLRIGERTLVFDSNHNQRHS